MDAYHVLVVILSIALAAFLVIATIATILIIFILRNIKKVTNRAQEVADDFSEMSSTIRKTAGPLAFIKIIAHVLKSQRRKK